MVSALPRRPRRHRETVPSSLETHNVVVGVRRTSVRLEPAMWNALHDIASQQQVSVHDLVTGIDRERRASSLTAAIRVYIVDFYRRAAMAARPVRAIRPTRFGM